MRIPAQLKVGGHVITVDCSQELDERDGDFSSKHLRIRICKSLPSSQREVTFFHEIFHALNSELDHTVLESLSQQLYQVLVDNKLLK